MIEVSTGEHFDEVVLFNTIEADSTPVVLLTKARIFTLHVRLVDKSWLKYCHRFRQLGGYLRDYIIRAH
jgi:hypothetical protein